MVVAPQREPEVVEGARTNVDGVVPPTPSTVRSDPGSARISPVMVCKTAAPGLETLIVLSLDRRIGAANVDARVLRRSSVPPSRLRNSVIVPPPATLTRSVPPLP